MATDINAPIGFALDASGDLEILVTGVGAGIRTVSGVEAVAQNIDEMLSTFKGEWFLDLGLGVPYYQDILGQKYDQERILNAFRTAILSVPNVTELSVLTSSYDGITRLATINWTALTPFGETSGSTST